MKYLYFPSQIQRNIVLCYATNWVSHPEIPRDPSLIKLCSHPATTTTFMCLTLWRGWKCSSLFIDTLPMKLVRPSSLYSISFTDSCTKTCFLICLKINLLCSTDRVLQQLVLEPGGWSRGLWDFPRTKVGWVNCYCYCGMVAIVIVSRIHVDCYCGMVVNDSDGGKRHGRNGGNWSGTWHGVSWHCYCYCYCYCGTW